jgi:MFS family permease
VIGRLRAYVSTFTGFEPDARRYLVVSLVVGAAISLWWVDFNLYLAAIGIDRATIGLIATAGSLAGVLVAFPASALSDRLGRRTVVAGSIGLMILALLGLLATTATVGILLLAALFGAGQQSLFVTQTPYLVEHSRPEHRSELFSLQFALVSVTNVLAAVAGGLVATGVAAIGGLDPNGPATYRVLLMLMTGLLVLGLVMVARLGDDRPTRRRPRELLELGEPAAFPPPRRAGWTARLGLEIRDRRAFGRILLPGFLIALGAGQVIPFLNLFVQRKFGLELASLNAAFAITSVGTMIAILLQPALAKRLGRIGSVVAVQATSIPFLVVLGFSPILWTVVAAMAVRNSLMNAGNPILNAFAMDQVTPSERATLSAAMSLTWSLGWVIAGPWYSFLQAQLGFEGGYAVNFLTIIVLYTTATSMYWLWFRHTEARPVRAPSPA